MNFQGTTEKEITCKVRDIYATNNPNKIIWALIQDLAEARLHIIDLKNLITEQGEDYNKLKKRLLK